MTHLARHHGENLLAREIAKEEQIPHHFLSKILQTLVRGGLLSSAKGRGGGFQLAKPPKRITLFHIKKCIDGIEDLDDCAVSLGRCHDKQPCPLHDTFKPIRESIRSYLKETTLEKMAAAVEANMKYKKRKK